jgi:hypothetical protein
LANKNDTVTEAIVRGLGAYLKAQVGFLQVWDDFPTAKQQLSMPCASIFTQSPRFTNFSPYVYRKSEAVVSDGKHAIDRVYGNWDFNLQVDIWCNSKLERHELFEKFMLKFNQNPDCSGLNLQLTDYFDAYARYDVTGVEFVDAEQATQRGEWRARVSVSANVRAIKRSLEHLIVTIENTVETPDEIAAPDEEDPGSII